MGKTYLRSKEKRKEGKYIWLIGDILFWLYRFEKGKLRSLILWIILKLEGDTLYSRTIRRIFFKYHMVDIGMYSSYGCFIPNNFSIGTKIGRYCTITGTARAYTANHPMNLKSMHSFFYHPDYGYAKKNILPRTKLTIGSDVYLGHNSIILPSVDYISDGVVIGAGAVVNKDIPPYAVVVGNPCKIVRYRFSKEKIKELLDSKWWEKSIEELLPDFDSFQHNMNNSEEIR